MPGQQPNIVEVFRIVHFDNVEYLLRNGMFRRNHPLADPNYINIGDSSLIAQRNDYPVDITPPNGLLGDYVPFYFGPLSPMLLNIKTGYRGITKRPQSEIVYIVCEVNTMINCCQEWCFTDGHAKNTITEFYNDLVNLGEVDWDIVAEKYWKNTEEDYDRMRRKQSEFLVKNHVPVNCISRIVVINETRKAEIEAILTRIGLTIPVLVNPNNQYYY
jgi:ssDNA thymidine ADP-ribosyltransferase, DarT